MCECEGSYAINHLEEFDPDDYIWYKGMTLEDVAYDIIEESYATKENEFLLRYFDYEAFGRELEFGFTATSAGYIDVQ